MKLCIVDLDGVVADNTERFARAEEAKQAALNDRTIQLGERQRTATQRFWDTAFTPELVALDTLIDGVQDALDALYGTHAVIFLTSRPESMREATQSWLQQHDISVEHPQFGNFLVMKPTAFQFTKTVTWKAGTIQMLAGLFNIHEHLGDEVLIVDDEDANLATIQEYNGSYRLCKSLAEAVAPDAVEESEYPF